MAIKKLRTKITLLFIFVFLIPLIVMNYFLIVEMEQSVIESAEDTLESYAVEVGSEIERFMLGGRDDIVVLANNPVIRCKSGNVSEKLEQMELTQNYHQIYDDITLIDTNGTVVTSTTYNYRGEWGTKLWYQEALKGKVVMSDGHVILDPFKVIVVFLSPVYTEKSELIGVLAGQIDLRELWSILDNVTFGETGFVYLINNQAKLISYPDKSLIFNKLGDEHPVSKVLGGSSGATHYTNASGVGFFWGYSSILSDEIYDNEGSWGVVVAQRSDEVLASVNSFRLQITQVIIGIVAVMVVVSIVVSRGIVRPIHRLEEGMREVAKGDLTRHVDVKSGDEIQYLADSFNKMIDDLNMLQERDRKRSEETERMLKMRVAKRTAQVEHLLKQKDEFIHQLGHDLKSPLNPIINLMPFLKESVSDKESREVVDIVSRNVQYIRDLIFDTLRLAELNSPSVRLEKEDINLKMLVDEIVEDNKPDFQQKHIEIKNKVAEGVWVDADELQLKEVLKNLSSNATKFMNEPGTITFQAQLLSKKDMVQVSVSDTGAGMDSKKLDVIFDEFYKIDPSRHDLYSSGLGLSICKRIVEKHGGKIWAESPGPGKGTTMHFTLPVSNQKK